MNRIASTSRPDWVSNEMYPFESKFFTTQSGQEMHYVDEGSGDPIVFVHGNPAWSFEFRHLISGLRYGFRCVAPDHIGFGLSSRSGRSGDHHPKSHAKRFAALIEHLDLRDLTLFVNDWGGPIGLDFARRRPDRVKSLVICNTWCWPVGEDFHFKSFSFLMSSRIGQYLIRHHNIFVNRVMPMAVGDRTVLTPEVMAHYRNALPSPAARAANAALPGYIVDAGECGCFPHPGFEVPFGIYSGWFHQRPSLHDAARDVGGLSVRPGKRFLVLVFPQANDQRTLPRPKAHVAVDQEANAPEHLLLGKACMAAKQRTDSLNQHFVFGHVSSCPDVTS